MPTRCGSSSCSRLTLDSPSSCKAPHVHQSRQHGGASFQGGWQEPRVPQPQRPSPRWLFQETLLRTYHGEGRGHGRARSGGSHPNLAIERGERCISSHCSGADQQAGRLLHSSFTPRRSAIHPPIDAVCRSSAQVPCHVSSGSKTVSPGAATQRRLPGGGARRCRKTQAFGSLYK